MKNDVKSCPSSLPLKSSHSILGAKQMRLENQGIVEVEVERYTVFLCVCPIKVQENVSGSGFILIRVPIC